MSSLGHFSYNKSFLYATVGAPGSTHDVRMLKNTRLYRSILSKNFSEKAMTLQGSGNIPLVTIGGSVFPRHPWLLKGTIKTQLINKNTILIKSYAVHEQ